MRLVRNRRMQKIGRTALFFLAAAGLTLVLLTRERGAPFDAIEFLQDHPGAGGRHVVFTPVLRADHSKTVGQPVGADFGVLHYRDCDGDGVNEAVVETDAGFWSGPSYRASVRHVYQYEAEAFGGPRAKLVSTEYMPERDPEWIRGQASPGEVARYCD